MVIKVISACILASILAEILCESTDVLVTISQGEIRGAISNGSTNYQAFKGIPYAKPPVQSPVQSLRLKNPEEPDSWPSTLDARNFKSKCPQEDIQGRIVGEEDCLYINVFVPTNREVGNLKMEAKTSMFVEFNDKNDGFLKTNERFEYCQKYMPVQSFRAVVGQEGSSPTKYPVMVFIHGGNFQEGSADPYNPELFVTSDIKVVLVTFNYRIGVLGFLSTGDETSPGNLGLKDQVFALKWVQKNIENFGGDPNSVTLFGQGSGAVSVFLHILSPESKGLFHKAITQSGSPLCNWTLAENPRRHAVEIAERLRCPTKSMSLMVDCIRDKPVKELIEAQNKNKTFGDYPLKMAPVVEKGGFLPDTPENLLNSGSFMNIPLLSGVNKDDGAIFYPLIKSYQDAIGKNSSILLNELIPTFLQTTTDFHKNIEFVSQAIHFQYFEDMDNTNMTQVLQSFINMTTDSMFVTCNYKTIESYAAKGAKVYTYVFEYKGEDSMLDVELGKKTYYDGVSNGDELLYLFDMKPSSVQNSYTKMQGALIYLWTTFATYGDFSNINYRVYPKWEPYTTGTKFYYKLDNDFLQEQHTSYRQRDINFWLNHLPNLTRIEVRGDKEVEYRTGSFGWAMLAIAIMLMVVLVALAVILLRKSKSQYFSTKTEEK